MKSHLVGLALVLAARVALGQRDSEVVLQDMTDADGNRQVFSIARGVAEKLPDWQPERQNPPLSIAKAMELAKAAAKKRHPKFDDFKITTIQIHGMNCYPVIPNKWFYTFDMTPVIDGKSFFGASMWEVVLMDGTVVPPQDKGKSDRAWPKPPGS
jgi:hypothetical protein